MKNKKLLVLGATMLLPSIFMCNTFADSNVVDEVTITVPVSCSMTGTVSTNHTSTIEPGTYESEIGETSFKVLCNDNNGFAVYAIGYSDNTDGNTTMKPSTLPAVNGIATGTATSGNTSNWAMKLTAVSGDYSPTLATGFNNYHAVPDEFTKVASLASSTDGSVGSSFKSTYAAYVSQSQPADTYTGKVKYTVIHPASIDAEALTNAVTINFNGNGLSFSDGTETNTMQYAEVCENAEQIYVGSTHQDVGTSNVGTNNPYTDSEMVFQPVTSSGADKLKVVVDYNVTGDTAALLITEGLWDGSFNTLPDNYEEIDSGTNITGTKTFYFDGDTVTVSINSWNTPEEDYDQGFIVKVYPVYNTAQAGATLEEIPCDCHIISISGSYEETTTWKGQWKLSVDGGPEQTFYNESDLIDYINDYYDFIKGSSITITAYNPIYLVYDGNGATSDFGMGNQYYYAGRDYGTLPLDVSEGTEVVLLAPNYKKNGYGFIGWSTDSNAASNIANATIYGPSQYITADSSLLSHIDENNNITLYAIWLQSAGNIQNWSGCSNMSIGDVTALTDTRDSNTYAVSKLADGNCWMAENLRLGGNSPINLTASNTQTAGTLPATGLPAGGMDNNTKAIIANNTISPSETANYYTARIYSYGNYYSWAAMINSTEQINIPYTGYKATTSICPSGWILPGRDDYYYLISELDGSTNALSYTSFPYNFVAGGYANSNGWISNSITYNYTGGIADYATSDLSNSGYIALFYIRNVVNGTAGMHTTGSSDTTYSSVISGDRRDFHTVRCMINLN